jgi:hypothetical protein
MEVFILTKLRCRNNQGTIVQTPSGRAVFGFGLPSLICWEFGFEFRRGHGCVFFVNVVLCQVEVFSIGRSLIQRSPVECGVSACDIETSTIRLLCHAGGGGVGGSKRDKFISTLL